LLQRPSKKSNDRPVGETHQQLLRLRFLALTQQILAFG
jgi:hypothetical protein